MIYKQNKKPPSLNISVDSAILVNNMAHARVLFPRFAIFSIGSVKESF